MYHILSEIRFKFHRMCGPQKYGTQRSLLVTPSNGKSGLSCQILRAKMIFSHNFMVENARSYFGCRIHVVTQDWRRKYAGQTKIRTIWFNDINFESEFHCQVFSRQQCIIFFLFRLIYNCIWLKKCLSSRYMSHSIYTGFHSR